MPIEYPIEVEEIGYSDAPAHNPKLLFGGHCGDFVCVRPIGKQYEDKTYLGVLLGEFPLDIGVAWNKETKKLTVTRHMYNPAIYIPDLKEVVFGVSSWWSKIKSPDDLREITNKDINDVWYVKALKALDPQD